MLDVAIDIERVPEIPDLLRRGLHVGIAVFVKWTELGS
jgi:hypothetical protein